MSTYHISNLGSFAPSDAVVDRDGFVATSMKAAMTLCDYGERITRDEARAIASTNREATRRALAALGEWRRAA